MTYMYTRSAIYNVGTRSSTYNKTATYNTNARSTMVPRKTSYNLDLRKPTTYDMNTRAATPYNAASSTGMGKTTSKTLYQVASNKSLSKPTETTTYQMSLSNSTVPNQVAGTQKYTNSIAYNLGTRQLEYGLTLDTIAKLIAPQQEIYNVSTGAASVINQKAISTATRPSNSQMPSFNRTAESTTPIISRPSDSQNSNKVLEKKALSVTMKPSECQISTLSTDAKYVKSTTTKLPPSSTSSTSSTSSISSTSSTTNTKQLSLQISASTNNMTSSPTSGRFARPTTPKSASNSGTGNVFVKTGPNTVVRAELIKNKTTKRAEPANSVSRTKEDEYKSGKKPKAAFKTKLVNKYCTYYHKYGRCKEGDYCAYKHDPNRVEVCKLWLKGSECMCLKDDCHYTHVKVSKRAPLCKDFMVGRYCPAGMNCRKKHEWGLYEEPTETESEAGKKHDRDPTEDVIEREKIKKLREEMANGVNPFAAGWTFIPIDD
ncbi:unnamed protein product [Rhizophagus irregularis]|uniref:C3H1-type domain-containing protein n=1 Tax=Rhizophagus irregularis TaxID=588596 RepID=A0A916E5A2_9GLOM|nr:unnamed protein product [Rhizophagus irregularis]CAB5361617.1 unnamed protein product [Rhizophagus irregularis]